MKDTNFLKEKINCLPDSSGVYIYKDANGEILYVGKAKNLKKRVQSYFTRFLDAKTQALVEKIADLEYRETVTEFQAQLLEASLIKEIQPKYNIDLKDDKSFPLIKISKEDFPLIAICRHKEFLQDKEKANFYYGPYSSAIFLRQALKVIRKIFGYRSCKQFPKAACLYFRLKMCPAPCIGKIRKEEYSRIIEEIKMFLDLKYEKLIESLTKQMELAAKSHEYEQAAKIRDQINALSALGKTNSKFSSSDELEDLKKLLKLKSLPVRIEGFDISNISGKEATGSMVSFHRGRPDKNNYRRFKIKEVSGIDDYSMLREVVKRRYSRLQKEKINMPDLVLIDGGKQHLLAAQDELKKLNLDLSLMSIAKDQEHVYVKGEVSPISFSGDTPALNLIRRVRDEAHRFARKYHHLLHKKAVFSD